MSSDFDVCVITLDPDRSQKFDDRNVGFIHEKFWATDARNMNLEAIRRAYSVDLLDEWIDPLQNRKMSLGEVGCAISHMRLWRQIVERQRPALIIEDDARIQDTYDAIALSHKLKSHDAIFLGYRWVREHPEKEYWYNLHGYALTPETAAYLLSGVFKQNMVPVDEYVSFMLSNYDQHPLRQYQVYRDSHHGNKLSVFFVDQEQIKQTPRSELPSTVEPKTNEDLVMSEKFHIVTVATEPEKMWALDQSAKKFGANVINIGKDHPWRDEMTSLAGMPKIHLMNEWLATVDPKDVVMFMDGYDTFLTDTPDVILQRYKEMDADIVFGAESEHWPLVDDEFMKNKWPDTGTKYKYLNSGLYIGTAEALHAFVSMSAPDSKKDDQLFCQLRYLAHGWVEGNSEIEWKRERKKDQFPYKIKLDYEAYIFQNHEPNIMVVGDQLWNTETNCCGLIYHGNGGDDAKRFFRELAARFGFNEPTDTQDVVESPYIMDLDFEVVANDILVTKFLTERQCQWLIDKSESHGGWEPMPSDKFPAYEIRLKEMGLWEEYERLWTEKLAKISEQYWKPMLHYGLRDAFTMRYSVDTQTTLGLHNDASHVTGSVKLNDNYEGGTLIYPRQHYDNKHVAVGDCILFPGQVTHGHYVDELTDGVKYSLTMWTSRYKGDLN